ncbi:MAG: hypothetical protein ACRDRN_08130 [Sciscionella sp.]
MHNRNNRYSGADLAEVGSLLVHVDLCTDGPQCYRCGEAADPGADDHHTYRSHVGTLLTSTNSIFLIADPRDRFAAACPRLRGSTPSFSV